MTDQPWLGDACSLVDAFRAGTLSPTEALDASLAAIEASELNAFSHLDAEAARAAAAAADVSLPFGGVPVGIKELEPVDGLALHRGLAGLRGPAWPTHDSTQVTRLRAAGAVLAGQTTASEFGGDQLHQHQAPRHHRQPVEPGADPGRLVGRLGGRGVRRAAAHRQRR